MSTQAEKIAAAVAAIRRHWAPAARAGVILGTGLGSVAAEIDRQATLPFDEIPHFSPATVVGHAGRLVCGNLSGLPVVALEGPVSCLRGQLRSSSWPFRCG